MSLHKRPSGYWHYDFIRNKTRFQGSTGQKNINQARAVEARLISEAALAKFGIAKPKPSRPLKDFLEREFTDYVMRNSKAHRTAIHYCEKVKRLLAFEGFAGAKLNEVGEELIERYKAWRIKTRTVAVISKAVSHDDTTAAEDRMPVSRMPTRTHNIAISTLNGELATIRKALNLAYRWELIQRRPVISLLPGANQRKFVVSRELEAEYLTVAPYPLREAAILMLDVGLRPEEAVSLRKSDILDEAQSVMVREGKSSNARRVLPLSERAKEPVSVLFALFPSSEFLFPGRKGHYNRKSLDNLHAKLRKEHGWPEEFVPHSFRHTFASRLAESGAQGFEIMAAMGHADIRMSQRYVHVSSEHLSLALRRKEQLDRVMRGEIPAHEEAPEKSRTS